MRRYLIPVKHFQMVNHAREITFSFHYRKKRTGSKTNKQIYCYINFGNASFVHNQVRKIGHRKRLLGALISTHASVVNEKYAEGTIVFYLSPLNSASNSPPGPS